MPWMRHATLGTLIGPIQSDGPMYFELEKQRSNNRPVWEDVGEQEVQSLLVGAFPQVTDPSQVQALGIIVPALAAAAATALFEMGNAQRAGAIVRAAYIPSAAVTGQATNFRTINVLNAGATGAGSTNAAALALSAGNNLTANQENPITLSGTQANLNVNSGDAIQWQSVLSGTGLADPGGIAVVTIALSN